MHVDDDKLIIFVSKSVKFWNYFVSCDIRSRKIDALFDMEVNVLRFFSHVKQEESCVSSDT